jgi:hypothetical protein
VTPMLNTPCPYCHAPTMPAPKKQGGHIHTECPNCHAHPAAKFTPVLVGDKTEIHVSYIRDGRKKTGAMQGVTIRFPDDLRAAIDERGHEWVRNCLRRDLTGMI